MSDSIIDRKQQLAIDIKLGDESEEINQIISEKLLGKEKDSKVKLNEKRQFRIDWRQLTYYQKSSSYLGRILEKFQGNSKSDQKEPNSDNSGIKPSKRILNSLDGCMRSGQLSAILGPSGAGKSTFLSTLFGSKQDNAYGQTRVTWFEAPEAAENSTQISDKLLEKRRPLRTAFLPQHDHLLHHLTVYETLLFASKIKNANRLMKGKNFHHQNVRRVAKMLKLTDCLDTRCKKLSGGQYKRVSIGQELLSEPDVIILDEPTSGLDAMTCLTTIMTLKSIVTKHPMSIILTIHQPDVDVFNLFDHIYVIAQGGTAIYEGPPGDLVATLAEVGLNMPSAGYNPARFIVENAFLPSEGQDFEELFKIRKFSSPEEEEEEAISSGEDDETFGEKGDYIRKSIVSLTGALSGKELASKRDKKPLLNIGIQISDGKLITSDKLIEESNLKRVQQLVEERLELIKKLNEKQKARYELRDNYIDNVSRTSGSVSETITANSTMKNYDFNDSYNYQRAEGKLFEEIENSSVKSDYSSAGCSERKAEQEECLDKLHRGIKSRSLAKLNSLDSNAAITNSKAYNNSLQLLPRAGGELILNSSPNLNQSESNSSGAHDFGPSSNNQIANKSYQLENFNSISKVKTILPMDQLKQPMDERYFLNRRRELVKGNRRQFDRSLSANFNNSKQTDDPIWYHALILTHRTWLSIIRDPIFFGIQACMHTTIPILLALIFGSIQEEGCPRIGPFDLVEFAYSKSTEDLMINGAVRSIRKSIGNIGIVFFEMFVLSFSINCITALVFPQDMFVLLKEYRNGWYSLRSYFIGRTLADLPVPIALHSLGMSILYYLTGQPGELWRFLLTIVLVILASLVAQSVGLTIGALLMKSSQSAVLAAAGIVAPFFALSGFIVRIHSLPWLAQLAAKASYLYHLLNGFIIMRYGFGRCQCKEEDFDSNSEHQIPNNLHTLASIWIGTYSNEFANETLSENKTSSQADIDVVEKMMHAFKMANSYGHEIKSCQDVLPYAMLDFNVRDQDIYMCFLVLAIMLLVSRFITFTAIYYKIRSFA